jgi:hypothetical protein
MTDRDPQDTRIIRPQPDAEQKGLVTDVVVPLAQTTITVGGMLGAAKIAKGKNDGK